MKSVFNHPFFQHQVYRWSAGAAGLLLLLLGVVLITSALRRPTPPDPHHATHAQMIDFVLSEDYRRMTSAERKAFYRTLAERYASFSSAERREFDALWRERRTDRDLTREFRIQMALGMARRMNDTYRSLAPEEREAFLDQALYMIGAFGPRARDFTDWMDHHALARATETPERMARNMSFFREDVLSSTDARERAELYQLGGDLLKRARERSR